MGRINNVKMPAKKGLVVMIFILITAVAAVITLLALDRHGSVGFTVLSEKDIPQEIAGEVIPEYRSLERALGCMVDDKVYVVVTRGEKPASGYKVDISRMKLEEEKGRQLLVVYADFCDPDGKDSISQVLTYPLKVAETDLEKLPDDIELRVQHKE